MIEHTNLWDNFGKTINHKVKLFYTYFNFIRIKNERFIEIKNHIRELIKTASMSSRKFYSLFMTRPSIHNNMFSHSPSAIYKTIFISLFQISSE